MNTRTSKLIFPAILFLFACLIAFGENGPTPKVVVGSSGISDGSVTNAKLSEPVAIEKGGTGKTTAAEGLAALGGASLNGSSTVTFKTSRITIYTPSGVDPWAQAAGSIELSPDEVADVITGYAGRGIMQVDMSTGFMGLFFIVGGEAHLVVQGAGGAYTVTVDNPGTYNVYGDGAGTLRIQNKTAATATARLNYQFRSFE